MSFSLNCKILMPLIFKGVLQYASCYVLATSTNVFTILFVQEIGRPLLRKKWVNFIAGSSPWAFGAKRTSYKHRCDVITSHRRRYDVILAPNARWDRSISKIKHPDGRFTEVVWCKSSSNMVQSKHLFLRKLH